MGTYQVKGGPVQGDCMQNTQKSHRVRSSGNCDYNGVIRTPQFMLGCRFQYGFYKFIHLLHAQLPFLPDHFRKFQAGTAGIEVYV
jgi:hypothetical protein